MLGLKFPTGNTLYAIRGRDSDLFVWNGASYESPLTANWDSYSIDLAEFSTTGYYHAADPDSGTAGFYHVYKLAGVSPDPSDTVVGQGSITLNSVGDITIDGIPLEDVLAEIHATVAGKTSGAGSDNELFTGPDGVTERVSVVFDSDNNRAVSYNR
jgi:hypothetical protein